MIHLKPKVIYSCGFSISASLAVWLISGWAARSLLVCLSLEWEEDSGIERPARRWLRVSPRSHSLKDGVWLLLTHRHMEKNTWTQANKHPKLKSGNSVNQLGTTWWTDFLFTKTNSFTQNVTSYFRGGTFLSFYLHWCMHQDLFIHYLYILTSINHLSFLDFLYVCLFFAIVNRAILYTFVFLTK